MTNSETFVLGLRWTDYFEEAEESNNGTINTINMLNNGNIATY